MSHGMRYLTPLLATRLGRGQPPQGQSPAGSFRVVYRAVKHKQSDLDMVGRLLAQEAASIDARLERRAKQLERAIKGVKVIDGEGYIDGCAPCYALARDLEDEAQRSQKAIPDERVCERCKAVWRVSWQLEATMAR